MKGVEKCMQYDLSAKETNDIEPLKQTMSSMYVKQETNI